MNNGNNSDLEQEEQERREQELREQQLRALRGQLHQSPDGGGEEPGQDWSKDPVIINK